MLKNVENATKEYMKKPAQFIWAITISVILSVISLFAMGGAFLIIWYILSLLGLGSQTMIVGIVGGIFLIMLLIITNGMKGALIKTFLNITKREKVSVRYFFRYALERGEVFFLITLIKYLVAAIPIVPLYLLYQYVLLGFNIPYLDWIIGIFIGGILFIIELPFMYAYVAAAVDNASTFNALKLSLRFLRKKHMYAFGLYSGYAMVWSTIYVPILNIFTGLVIYPIMYTAIITFYSRYK